MTDLDAGNSTVSVSDPGAPCKTDSAAVTASPSPCILPDQTAASDLVSTVVRLLSAGDTLTVTDLFAQAQAQQQQQQREQQQQQTTTSLSLSPSPSAVTREQLQTVLDVLVILGLLVQVRHKEAPAAGAGTASGSGGGMGKNTSTASSSSGGGKLHYSLASHFRCPEPLPSLLPADLACWARERVARIDRLRRRTAELQRISAGSIDPETRKRQLVMFLEREAVAGAGVGVGAGGEGDLRRTDPLYRHVCRILSPAVPEAAGAEQNVQV